MNTIESLEISLDDFDPKKRAGALDALIAAAGRGEVALPAPGTALNLHSHTFFSFNGYGYSPTGFAWRARRAGLCGAGIVDFDVLDGVDEFLRAANRLGLRACAGIETRVFIPEFDGREVNSPGEPGIAYHMGVGFGSSTTAQPEMLRGFKQAAQDRNRDVVNRVNAFLDPVAVDYARDVLPLTPDGNATERHICAAYDLAAQRTYPDAPARATYWAGKLGSHADELAALSASPPDFQALIRAKTMKKGGAGYVQPRSDSFPLLRDANRFVLACGAIPTIAWLDGCSAGEAALDELFAVHRAAGSAMLNIIPDRNWNIADPEQRRTKVANLYAVVESARANHFPIIVGTEMNAHGQRFVDDFTAPELAPLLDDFALGAHIAYGHTRLLETGIGYTSAWAATHFESAAAKNAFYAEVGKRLAAGAVLSGMPDNPSPDDVLSAIP